MRAFEFTVINEAVLDTGTTYTSWPNYLQGLLNGNISLGTKGEQSQGLSLDNQSKKIVQQLIAEIPTAANKTDYAKQIANTTLNFTNGSSAKIRQIFKSSELKGSTEDTPKLQTRTAGLVSEGLLGVAMFAKLTARGGDLTDKITSKDVWAVVSRIKSDNDNILTATVNDVNNQVSDSVNLEISLAVDIKNALIDPKFRPLFEDKVTSWVNYVNGDLSQKYADILYKNNRPDNITIRLAGTEGGKIDVVINVLDKEGKPTKKLEQVKLSVKLADSLIGQQARGSTHEEVYENLEKLFSPLAVNLGSIKDKILKAALASGVQSQFAGAMELAYQEAAKQLKNETKDAKSDATLASRLAKLTDFHATGNDPEIQVIEQTPDADYRLLNYKGLKQVFEKNNIDLEVRYITGASSRIEGAVMPRILFFDKNNQTRKGKLLEIRFRARGNYANHIIEPGPLLKELAAYRKFKSK
jgi:hypothetical protein